MEDMVISYLAQHTEPDEYELLFRHWHGACKLIMLKNRGQMYKNKYCKIHIQLRQNPSTKLTIIHSRVRAFITF